MLSCFGWGCLNVEISWLAFLFVTHDWYCWELNGLLRDVQRVIRLRWVLIFHLYMGTVGVERVGVSDMIGTRTSWFDDWYFEDWRSLLDLLKDYFWYLIGWSWTLIGPLPLISPYWTLIISPSVIISNWKCILVNRRDALRFLWRTSEHPLVVENAQSRPQANYLPKPNNRH